MKHIFFLILCTTQLNAADHSSQEKKEYEIKRDSYALYVTLNHVFHSVEFECKQQLPQAHSGAIRQNIINMMTGDSFGHSFGYSVEFYMHSYPLQRHLSLIKLSAKNLLITSLLKSHLLEKNPEDAIFDATRTSFYTIAPQLPKIIATINQHVFLSTFQYFEISADQILTSLKTFQRTSKVPYAEEFYKEALSAIEDRSFSQNLEFQAASSIFYKRYASLTLEKSSTFKQLPTDLTIIITSYIGDYGYLKKSGLINVLHKIKLAGKRHKKILEES